MKLLREEDGLYSGALQIVGKCVEFAMSVGNVPLGDGRTTTPPRSIRTSSPPSALATRFSRIIGGIQMILHLRVRALIEPART